MGLLTLIVCMHAGLGDLACIAVGIYTTWGGELGASAPVALHQIKPLDNFDDILEVNKPISKTYGSLYSCPHWLNVRPLVRRLRKQIGQIVNPP